MEIDKMKMDELLGLLEELVINKVRIEKIQNEIKDSQHKKILGTEIQIVSKVQEVIKDIQSSTLKPIYDKLKDLFAPKSKMIEFNGHTSKFDYFNEEQIQLLLKTILEHIVGIYSEEQNEKIIITGYNDSVSLILEVNYSAKHLSLDNLMHKFDRKYFPLTKIPKDEIHEWLSEIGLADFMENFHRLYETANSFGADIEMKSEDGQNSKVVITIPVSTSIVTAQLVQINNLTYAIPAEHIEKVMNTNLAMKKTANNRLFISYMDKVIPVISIDKELQFRNDREYTGYVILMYNKKMKALPVHSLLDQLDIVVKSKPLLISEIYEFKGTSILGDGNAVMVFDIPYLIENAS